MSTSHLPHDSILETIGNTPVVRLSAMAPPDVEVFVKLEAFNPMGSVKDRMALAVIEDAEARGDLVPGQTVVEATSGNTGIALAMVCARKGYPLVVVMAENFSIERRRLMRFLGARVVLTPAAEMGSGMLAKAEELARTHGWFLPRQFDNPANAQVHSRTTAREILQAFDGQRLDAWVSGFGTGGTLAGVARVLKRERPEVRIVACEPDNSPVLASGVPQPRGADGRPAGSHPHFRPHLMQGWAPDFVGGLTQGIIGERLIDEIVPIDGQAALDTARDLARREGILTGITGGATLAGALDLCRRLPAGSRVLCMLPDTGERYLSTTLFEHIDAQMNAEEIAISCSTPSVRFDAPPPPVDTAAVVTAPADAQAEAVLESLLSDPDNPVVMFALAWCEFCWSARKLFAAAGVAVHAVELDAPAWQTDDLGGRVRQALNARTGWVTIPQIFIGGAFIGGCTDLMDAFASGALQRQLAAAGLTCKRADELDPTRFFPAWLHPR